MAIPTAIPVLPFSSKKGNCAEVVSVLRTYHQNWGCSLPFPGLAHLKAISNRSINEPQYIAWPRRIWDHQVRPSFLDRQPSGNGMRKGCAISAMAS